MISLSVETKLGTRVGGVHVHLDGTFKFFPSREGKQGGYWANIKKAKIERYIPEMPEEESSEAGQGAANGMNDSFNCRQLGNWKQG